MVTRWLLAGVLLIVPPVGFAETPAKYLGVSIGGHELGVEDHEQVPDHTADLTNFELRFGYFFGDFLGVELRGGRGDDGDTSPLESPTLTHADAYVRLNLPFEDINIFFLGGASAISYDHAAGDVSESGPSAGLGIELYGTDRTALTLSYMTRADDAYEGFNIGLMHHFEFPSFR